VVAVRSYAALLLAALVVASSLGIAAPVAGTDTGTVILVETGVSDRQPTTDENVTVTATVSNLEGDGADYIVRSVRVFNGTTDRNREELASVQPRDRLAPGETRTVNLSVGIDEVGRHDLLVKISLLSTGGDVRQIERVIGLEVRDPHPVVGLGFEPTLAGSPTNATLTVANGLDGPVRNVEVRLSPARTTLTSASHVFARVEPGAERTVSFGVRGDTTGTETITARLAYSYNGTRYTTERQLTESFVEPTNPGRITLNNLRVEETAAGLRIRGTASNPGGSDVTGVTVSVVAGDGVEPAANNAEFFVGRVVGSDFGTFEAAAEPTRNGSVTIPIRAEYLVDGVQRETVRSVAYTPEPEPSSDPETSGLPLSVLGGVAVVVGLLGVVGWRVRRGRN
jgi:hypothetical protein